MLAELQDLVARRRVDLLTGPGWIYLQYHSATSGDCGGVMLPTGLYQPCEIDHYAWSELNERGEVIASITRELDPSGNVFQEYITKDSIGRNFTFGYEYTATLTDTYSTDWGFAALAAEAVADGELLTRLSPSAGEADDGPVVYMIWADGVLQREATFDPQTGALLAVVIYTPNTRGQDNYETATIMTEERIDQPPAEALALLDQPLQPYQTQPQAEPTATPTAEAPAYVTPGSFQEQEVIVGSGEWSLTGTLTLPAGAGPFPAVVLVHWWSRADRDRDDDLGPNKPFRDLAWGLASQGIAVLRYEKRAMEYAQEWADLAHPDGRRCPGGGRPAAPD